MLMKRGIAVLFALILLLAVGANVGAGATLYGATAGSADSGDLYTINPSTGAGSLIGPIVGPGGAFAVTGLAFDPLTGILYGSTSRHSATSPGSLITINPATGAATLVGSYGLSGNTMADITFTSNGTLFGWAEPTVKSLAQIDVTTGAATPIGPGLSQSFGSGLAANASDVLYYAGSGANGELSIIDATTGIVTPVANLNDTDPFAIGALAFSNTGVLFGIETVSRSSSILITINTSTGHVTDIGPTATNMDALAFAPTAVPEPATMVLLGCGLIAMGYWRRQRPR